MGASCRSPTLTPMAEATVGEQGQSGDPPVGPPVDTALPFFAYGLLKPDELGFRQLESQVTIQQPGEVRGRLRMCDGLPVLDLDGGGGVRGWVLDLNSQAYDAVGSFEPANLYKWGIAQIEAEPSVLRANVLLRNPESKIKVRDDGGDTIDEWSAATDPVLHYGLPAVASIARRTALKPFLPSPLSAGEWRRYFELQAGYLLACSVLERVATLELGRMDPTARIHRFGKLDKVRLAFAYAGVTLPSGSVASARGDQRVTPGRNGKDFVRAAYQVRSNLAHRGKGAFAEAELVRLYLLALHNVLRQYLLERVPGLAGAWTAAEGASDTRWRIVEARAPAP